MEKFLDKQNEIISLLNNMRLKHLNVQVYHNGQTPVLTGYVTKVDLNGVSIFFDNIPETIPIKNLKICFEYSRNYYSSNNTDLKLLNVQLKNIELLIPSKLSFHPVRRYTRVPVYDDAVKLVIKKIDSQNEQKRNINIDELPATLRNIYLELTNENPDLKKIVGMIGEELNKFTNKFRINIFKDLNTLSPLERVVEVYKKTFWIEDTENMNSFIHLRDKYSVIGYEKYFEMVKKVMSPEILEKIKQNYIDREIISYALVPIIIGDRVIGTIEVTVPNDINKQNNQPYKKLNIYDIFYIKGLADILGEVVVKSRGVHGSAETTFTVIDISIGGILASTKNIYLVHELRENSIVTLGIISDDKEIELQARVVRYNYVPGENAGINVAFDFILSDPSLEAQLGSIIKKLLKLSLEKKQ